METQIRDCALRTINVFYDSNRSAGTRKAADDWLTKFRDSDAAWLVLPSLLLDQQLAQDVKQFAAVNLRRKIWAGAASMSDSQLEKLRNTLLQCVLFEGQPAIVVEDLCSSLALVAVHWLAWETALDDLAQVLPPRVMLMLLQELPSQIQETSTRTSMPNLERVKEKVWNWSSSVISWLAQQDDPRVIDCFEQWVEFGALLKDDVPHDAAGTLIQRTFELLRHSDSDPWTPAYAAQSILSNIDYQPNGSFLYSLIADYPESAVKMCSIGEYDRAACLVDVYCTFCAGELQLLKSACPEGKTLRTGLLTCLEMPVAQEVVTEAGDPVIRAAVATWESVAQDLPFEGNAEEGDEFDAIPQEGGSTPLSRTAAVGIFKRVLELLLLQMRPTYDAADAAITDSPVLECAKECLLSIHNAIGSQEFMQTVMEAVPLPLGLRPSLPDQPFDWQTLEAALLAVGQVEDPLGDACGGPVQTMGHNLLRLVLNGWQMLSPGLVPHVVNERLQKLFMLAVTGLVTPLMALMGSDVSRKKEIFRFVVERSAATADSSLVGSMCVVAAMEAALREKVPVEEDILALLLSRMHSVSCKADCRCQLGEAFAAGLLGSPRIQEPGSAALTFVRTMLGYLLSGVEPALAALRTVAPTTAAIEVATSAITDIMSVLVRATDFAAQAIPGNPLAVGALEVVGQLWLALQSVLLSVDVEPMRCRISIICQKAIHAESLAAGSPGFMPLLPSFLETSVKVFTRTGGYSLAQPLVMAVETYRDNPAVEAQLAQALNAISGLPEVTLLSQPEAADHYVDLAQGILKLTMAAARQETSCPPVHLLAEGVRRSSAASACNHRDVASLGVGCLEELTGLVGSPRISKALKAELVSAVQQLGPLLIGRLIQTVHSLHGGTRVLKVVAIFCHLVAIEGMREVLVTQWLPVAVAELQKGVLTEPQAQKILGAWVPLLLSAPAVKDASQILQDQKWAQFRKFLRDPLPLNGS